MERGGFRAAAVSMALISILTSTPSGSLPPALSEGVAFTGTISVTPVEPSENLACGELNSVGVAVAQISDFTPPVFFEIISGSLPPGTQLDGLLAFDGLVRLAGQPQVFGEFTFAFRVTDAAGNIGVSPDITVTVDPGLCGVPCTLDFSFKNGANVGSPKTGLIHLLTDRDGNTIAGTYREVLTLTGEASVIWKVEIPQEAIPSLVWRFVGSTATSQEGTIGAGATVTFESMARSTDKGVTIRIFCRKPTEEEFTLVDSPVCFSFRLKPVYSALEQSIRAITPEPPDVRNIDIEQPLEGSELTFRNAYDRQVDSTVGFVAQIRNTDGGVLGFTQAVHITESPGISFRLESEPKLTVLAGRKISVEFIALRSSIYTAGSNVSVPRGGEANVILKEVHMSDIVPVPTFAPKTILFAKTTDSIVAGSPGKFADSIG
jgi:hypothetical protein